MAKKTKTWAEKLADAKAKMPKPKKFYCDKTKQQFVIAPVEEIEALIRTVRKGRLLAMNQITGLFRMKYRVDVCCPITAGIFSWIVAHAAHEQEEAGRKRVVPWWRVLKTGGVINPKYPGQGAVQRARLEAEGHKVVQKGRKLVVADYEKALANLKPAAASKKPANKGTQRKVLKRGGFGLCVLLPKTDWTKLPGDGAARVLVDGKKRRVTVQVERCNCQGTGWHEHRFLSLPKSAGVKEGDRVTIAFGVLA